MIGSAVLFFISVVSVLCPLFQLVSAAYCWLFVPFDNTFDYFFLLDFNIAGPWALRKKGHKAILPPFLNSRGLVFGSGVCSVLQIEFPLSRLLCQIYMLGLIRGQLQVAGADYILDRNLVVRDAVVRVWPLKVCAVTACEKFILDLSRNSVGLPTPDSIKIT